MIIGYTTGVYDLFHIGHFNLFKNVKGLCDKLVVGVTVDELVQYKGKNALIPFECIWPQNIQAQKIAAIIPMLATLFTGD